MKFGVVLEWDPEEPWEKRRTDDARAAIAHRATALDTGSAVDHGGRAGLHPITTSGPNLIFSLTPPCASQKPSSNTPKPKWLQPDTSKLVKRSPNDADDAGQGGQHHQHHWRLVSPI